MKLIGNISTLIGLILFIYSIIPLVKGLRNIKISDIRNKLLKRAGRAFSSSLLLSTLGLGMTPAGNTVQLLELAEGLLSGRYFSLEQTAEVGEESYYQAVESKEQEGLAPHPQQSFATQALPETDQLPESHQEAVSPPAAPPVKEVTSSHPGEIAAAEIVSPADTAPESVPEAVPADLPATEAPLESIPEAEPSPAELDQLYVDADGRGLIKGSSWGNYHLPDSLYYERIIYPVAWFKSVEEAVEAGYDAPEE